MQPHQSTITILNNLISVNKERITDYQKAIEHLDTGSKEERMIYGKLIDQGLKFIEELKIYVYLLGGSIEQASGAHGVYHTWATLREEYQSQKFLNTDATEYYLEASITTYKKAIETTVAEVGTKEMLKRQADLLQLAYAANKAKKVAF